jgi:hypothetical protein
MEQHLFHPQNESVETSTDFVSERCTSACGDTKTNLTWLVYFVGCKIQGKHEAPAFFTQHFFASTFCYFLRQITACAFNANDLTFST